MYVRGIHPIKSIHHFLRMLMNLIINRAWASFHTDCGDKKNKRGNVWFGGFNDEEKCFEDNMTRKDGKGNRGDGDGGESNYLMMMMMRRRMMRRMRMT